MRVVVASLLALAATAGIAHAADTWAVREGPEGKTQGTWTIERNGESLTGSANMIGADGKPVKYRVAGRANGPHYTLRRSNSSDGVDCTYVGQIDAKAGAAQKTFDIAGSAICRGKTGMWSAHQLPRQTKR